MSHLAKRIKLSDRRGFTALELIIVLVVGFSIIALSASKMGQLFSASSTTAAMQSLLDIYSSTRLLRGPNGYGEEDFTKGLITAGMMPKGFFIQGTTAKNEWGGEVTVKGAKKGFDITYNSVPGDACAKIAPAVLNSETFQSIQINEKEVNSKSLPSEIINNCGEKTPATMIFNFVEDNLFIKEGDKPNE
ncbi:MAG: type 4 pilus major pilin [Candidatus Symbiodolus clandestinus]